MTEPGKQELELLKAVANEPYEKGKAKWNRLLKALHLSNAYVPAIQEVLRQRGWQNQTNPVSYVRKAAVRWAVRHGLAEIRRKSSKEAPASEISSIREDHPSSEEDKLISELCQFDDQRRDQPIADLLSADVMNEDAEVNWEKVAQLASLDPGEKIVLDLKLMGLSWRDAIAACLTTEDRTILNTAWRRFDRHKNVLKQVLLTGKHQHIRRTASVPALELMFSEGEDRRLRIFFKRVISR
jgi:hypothetical protein